MRLSNDTLCVPLVLIAIAIYGPAAEADGGVLFHPLDVTLATLDHPDHHVPLNGELAGTGASSGTVERYRELIPYRTVDPSPEPPEHCTYRC